MEFIIKDLQIFCSTKVDQKDVVRYLNLEGEKPTAKNIRSAFDSNRTTKFDSGISTYIHINRNLYNSQGKLIGVLANLNFHIKEHLELNNLEIVEEWFVIKDSLDNKFLKILNNYISYPINLVSHTMFQTLCNCPIKVNNSKEFITSLTEEWLERQFGEVQNLNLLGNEEVKAPSPVVEVVNNDEQFEVIETGTLELGDVIEINTVELPF